MPVRRLALPVLLLIAAACSKETPVTPITTARAEAFIGVPVPPGATNVRTAGEDGVDRLVLLGFEADDVTARAYAAQLLGAPPRRGVDPGLAYLGSDVAWWPQRYPAGGEGGEISRSDNRVIKLILAPAPGQPTRVFVAAMSR